MSLPRKPTKGFAYPGTPFLIAIATLLMAVTTAIAAPIEVPATANIFGAGHATPPAPGGNGAGNLPPMIPVTPGQAISFTSVTGTVTYSNGSFDPAVAPFGPEGSNGFDTSLASVGGISSINGNGFLWLVGVFLDDSEPVNPAPAGLPFFTTAAKQFTSLSPGLRQIFFIGDGRQSGSSQAFIAPSGATRLFLGFADGDGGSGNPGFYGDNAGSLSVTLATPYAPGSLIGHWVADDLPLGASGNWTSRVNATVAQIDRGSPQVSTGGAFNGHRYVTFNPSTPDDTTTADTFSVAPNSASHPAGTFSMTVVFRMPITASGSGSTSSGNWYENVGLVGMEVAGAPNPPDWIFGIDGANHLSGAGVRGTTTVNSNKVIIATVTYTETEQFMYVNGVLEGQFAMGRTTSLTTTPYAFGANRASSGRGGTGFAERFFTGDIAEIRIHGSVVDAQAEFAALQAIYSPPPRIVSFQRIGGVPRISFTTVEGSSYRIERHDVLTPGPWLPVTGASSVPGTGGIVDIDDPDAGTAPQRFYRVAPLP